jgi:hypothetical protein
MVFICAKLGILLSFKNNQLLTKIVFKSLLALATRTLLPQLRRLLTPSTIGNISDKCVLCIASNVLQEMPL